MQVWNKLKSLNGKLALYSYWSLYEIATHLDKHLSILCYFSSHNNETTHWLDPRLAHLQKEAPLDCDDDGECCNFTVCQGQLVFFFLWSTGVLIKLKGERS